MITINKFLREIAIQWHNSPYCFLSIHLGHEPTLWIFSCANPFLFAFSLQYNDYVHFIEPCFKGILVQADRDNREVSTGPLSMELGWLSSCKQSTGLRCCEMKLWGQGTVLSQQGLGFRSQQQFSGVCWLRGSPWLTPSCCSTGSAGGVSSSKGFPVSPPRRAFGALMQEGSAALRWPACVQLLRHPLGWLVFLASLSGFFFSFLFQFF